MAVVVLIPPSPHDPLARMATTTRRAPLANLQNATNSPQRFLTTSASKRSRPLTSLSQQENEPHPKRQALERANGEPTPVTPRRPTQGNATAEGRVFERGHGESGSNAFQRRLVAARDRTSLRGGAKPTENKDMEVIRQWQKHYRKAFPTFSFYFDSVPDDQRARFVRHISHLGAREEKFFSKNVTHIVTTRPIANEDDPSQTVDGHDAMRHTAAEENAQTINPSLLDKTFHGRPMGGNTVRREVPKQNDILTRGKQMGMKIWAAEKLQRILTSITEDAGTPQAARGQPGGARVKEDLSQVLKKEKIGATAEREQVSVPREIVPFRGPFIYIHDIDEKTRPIMYREYSKVARRQDGEWPQFRSAPLGKCPFVEDPAMKKEMEQERERQRQKALLSQQHRNEAQKNPRARSSVTLEPARMNPPRRTSPRKPLRDTQNVEAVSAPSQPVANAAPKPERQSSFPPMPEQPPVDFVRPAQMHLAREPAASGIQRSVTSAIQSQMISSTAGTGAKAATSKEVHELKRKVLERQHTGSLSVGSISSSHRTHDLAGAMKNARAPAPTRAAKSRAQEKLGGIPEEVDPYADDLAAERSYQAGARKRKAVRRDPKPGYCENCRDKYDDFEEHVVSRKHRKFAMTQSNWDELDALLSKLQAP